MEENPKRQNGKNQLSLRTVILMHGKSFSDAKEIIRLLLLVFPALLLTWFIATFGVNVPFHDQWHLTPFFYRLHEGTVGLKDLFALHNEHRIAFPRIIFSILAFTTRWNVIWELFTSLAIAVIAFLLLYDLSKRTSEDQIQTQFLSHVPNLLMATLFFSLSQYENWLWGFQLTWFLINFCLVSSIYIIYRSHQIKSNYLWLVAALPCFIASFSSAHGLLLWLATVPSVFASQNSTKGRIKRLFIWSILFVLSLGLYLVDYSKPPGHPSLSFLLLNPLAGMHYFFSFLGSSIVLDKKLAFLVGFLLFVYFVFLTYSFLKPLRAKFVYASPWLSLGLYSLLFAGLTTMGRAGFGVSQAMTSRYRTSSILLVIAVLQLGAIALRRNQKRSGSGDLLAARPVYLSFHVFKVLLGVVFLSFLLNTSHFMRVADGMKAERETAKYCLELVYYMEGTTANPCSRLLYPSDIGVVQSAAPQLEALGFRQIEKNVEFWELSRNPNRSGQIDVIGSDGSVESIAQDSWFPIQGWAAYSEREDVPSFVLFSYNEQRSFFGLAQVNIDRPDVAKALGDSRYLHSGWQANIASEDLPPGDILVRAWIFDPENSRFVELGGRRIVRLGE